MKYSAKKWFPLLFLFTLTGLGFPALASPKAYQIIQLGPRPEDRPKHFPLPPALEIFLAGQTDEPVDLTPHQPELPSVRVQASDRSASEWGPSSGTFVFLRTGDTTLALAIRIEVRGTASSGEDYAPFSETVTFPAGFAWLTILVTPVDDRLIENTETVVVAIKTSDLYRIGEPAAAEVTISDNDQTLNVVPVIRIVSPAESNTINAPATVEIRAEASDADGTIKKVDFLVGDRVLGTDETSPYGLTWSNLAAGIYLLSARATDNSGATATAGPLKILVQGDTLLPAISVIGTDPEATEPAGPDATADPGAFTFTRTGDIQSDLRIYYEVSGTAANGIDYVFLDGDAVIRAGSKTREILIQPLSDKALEELETVVLKLKPRETYTVGTPDTARVAIRDFVLVANQPPTVALVEPKSGATFTAPTNITIRAEAADADGEVSKVEFFAGDRQLGTLSKAPYSLTWSNVPPGIFVFTARATDNRGTRAESEPIKIEVKGRVAHSAITITATDGEAAEPAGPDATADSGAFTFTRTGDIQSDLRVYYEVSGTAANGIDYVFLDGDAVIRAGSETREILIQPLSDKAREELETVVLKLKPRETYTVGTPDTARVAIRDFVLVANKPPTVALVEPKSGATFTAPTNIFIRAEAADADGEVSKVEFFAGDRLLGTLSKAPFSLTWSNVPPGIFVLTARATDNSGARATSEPIKIEVKATPSLPSVTVAATDAEAAEPLGNEDRTNHGTFTLTRTGDIRSALRVDYVVGGTASNGVDYVLLDGDATIETGAKTRNITLQPRPDGILEGRETVELKLKPAAAYTIGSPGHATVVINDANLPNPAPSLTITKPANGDEFSPPAKVLIQVTAIDPRSYISRVEFFAGPNKLGVSEITFIRAPDPGTPIEHSFEWTNVVAGHYELTARAADGTGTTITSKPVRIEVGESPTVFAAKINFQPASVSVPRGYLPDSGEVFGDRKNGFSYGWNADNRGNTRNRDDHRSPDQRYDTFAYLQVERAAFAWEMAVPNGIYHVRVVVGDPESIQSLYGVLVEGKFAVGGQPLGMNRWFEGSVLVSVQDGRLTVSNAPESRNNKICFIDIEGFSGQIVQPVVNVVASDPDATEEATRPDQLNNAAFVVTRTGSTSFALPVFFKLSGTALNGIDYSRLSSITIPVGAGSATVLVRPIDDRLAEAEETVIFTLEAAVCPDIIPPPPTCYLVGPTNQARVSIHDRDEPVNAKPSVSIVMPANNSVFTAPATIALLARANDTDGWVKTVEFFQNEKSLGVTTNHPLSLGPINPFQLTWTNVPPGSYTLTAKATDNQDAIAWSGRVIVKVNEEPQAIRFVNQPKSQTVGVGESAVFSVIVIGAEPMTYRWRLNGTDIPGTTNLSLILDNVTTNQSGGLYSLVASNQFGVAVSAEALLTVKALPPLLGDAAVWLNNFDVNQPIRTADGKLAPVEGAWVQVLGGVTVEALKPLVSTSGKSVFALVQSGFFDGGMGIVPGVTAGGEAHFQVLAWGGSTNYDSATHRGKTAVFTQHTGANPPPPNLPSPAILLVPASISLQPAVQPQVLALPRPAQALRATPNPPVITSLSRLKSGECRLTIAADAGQSVVVEASIDLITWQPLSALTSQTGIVEFIDPDAAHLERCFYRALSSP